MSQTRARRSGDLRGNIEVKEMRQNYERFTNKPKNKRVLIKKLDRECEFFMIVNWIDTSFIVIKNELNYDFKRLKSLYYSSIIKNAIFISTDLVKTYEFLKSIAKNKEEIVI